MSGRVLFRWIAVISFIAWLIYAFLCFIEFSIAERELDTMS